MKCRKYALSTALLVLAGFTLPAYASTAFNGAVGGVGTYGNGNFFFFLLGAAINEPGCTTGQARIDVPASHPKIREITAIVLSAKAMDKALQGTVHGCFNGFPTFDSTSASYLYTVD